MQMMAEGNAAAGATAAAGAGKWQGAQLGAIKRKGKRKREMEAGGC